MAEAAKKKAKSRWPVPATVPGYAVVVLGVAILCLNNAESVAGAAAAGARMSEDAIRVLGWYSPLFAIPVVAVGLWVSRQTIAKRREWGDSLNSMLATVAVIALSFVLGFNVRPTGLHLSGDAQTRVANTLGDSGLVGPLAIHWKTDYPEAESYAKELGRAINKLQLRQKSPCINSGKPEAECVADTELVGPKPFPELDGTGVMIEYGQSPDLANTLLVALCAEAGIHIRKAKNTTADYVWVWVKPNPERSAP